MFKEVVETKMQKCSIRVYVPNLTINLRCEYFSMLGFKKFQFNDFFKTKMLIKFILCMYV